MNKKQICFFMLIAALLGFNLQAQQAEDALRRGGTTVIPEAYDRSSISLMLVYQNGDPFSSMLLKGFGEITQSDKFFINPLAEPIVRYSRVRNDKNRVIHQQHILKTFEEKDYAQEIVSFWYNRTEEGYMDMERIHERGIMNATVEEVMRNQVTTRGNWALMDYGNRLIEKSYIIVMDFTELKRVDTDTYAGFSGNVRTSLFRINLSEEDRGQIYDAWVLPEDSQEEAAAKRALFEEINPDIEYITSVYTGASAHNYKEHTFLGRITEKRSDEALIASLVQRAYDQTLTELERRYDDFNVITPLHSTRPLAARIGKKEGLKVDQRFFVYEHRYNPSTQEIVEHKRGVIRVGREITDNRDMASVDMEPSKFYQVSGRRLHEGYILQQNNDFGLNLRFDYSTAEMGGVTAELGASVGRFLGIPSFYLTGMAGFDGGSYDNFVQGGEIIYPFERKNLSFLKYGLGLAKGYHIIRNFELRPHFGVFFETARNEDVIDEEIQGMFLNAGGTLGIHVAHYMQLVIGYNQFISIGNASYGEDDTDYNYTDIFPGREGGAPFFGIRFIF